MIKISIYTMGLHNWRSLIQIKLAMNLISGLDPTLKWLLPAKTNGFKYIMGLLTLPQLFRSVHKKNYTPLIMQRTHRLWSQEGSKDTYISSIQLTSSTHSISISATAVPGSTQSEYPQRLIICWLGERMDRFTSIRSYVEVVLLATIKNI